MFEEPVPRLLSDLVAELVLIELRLLKEFGDFLIRSVALFLLSFSVLDILEEELVCLIVNFLCRSLGFGLDILLEGGDPVYFLRHLKYNNGNK